MHDFLAAASASAALRDGGTLYTFEAPDYTIAELDGGPDDVLVVDAFERRDRKMRKMVRDAAASPAR